MQIKGRCFRLPRADCTDHDIARRYCTSSCSIPALVPLIATLFESPELLSLFNYAICHIAFPMAARYGVSIPERDFTCDGLTVPHRDEGEQDWELQRHFTHENLE